MKLGLVTGSLIPRPEARPLVKVVLPAPTSPISSMTTASVGFVVFFPFKDDESVSFADIVCI